ncbi:Ribosomal protein L10P [Dillenia turbinata]|uniref:Ribosomal protein L10P n=1 Tax=Dillenia turbinata TaxID=194707 RepID=A0AAN8V3Y1_9MAGN
MAVVKKPSKAKAVKEGSYDQKLHRLLDEYSQILVVSADNVGSRQLQNIRMALRDDSVILMVKNTMIKRSVRLHAENTGNSAFLSLSTLLVGRIRFLHIHGFTYFSLSYM